jgi:general secretion pathway protein L
MAHITLGVDLGAATIKLARFEAGFRKAQLLELRQAESAQLAEGASAPERVAAQLVALKRALDGAQPVEEIALGLPGDLLTFRVLDLPFSDPKRIEAVLGYELEAQVLTPIEELFIDHVIVGPRGDQTRVLCVAAPRVVVEATVKAAGELGLPVRVIGAAPLAYAAYLTEVAGPRGGAVEQAGSLPPGPHLLVDVGHDHTTVVALQGGKPEMARSIPRAGRHFTESIMAAFRLDADAAERAKLEAGFIGHAGLAAETPAQKRMDECLREAARALVREIKQTVASYRASYGSAVTQLWVTGGGARLVGLTEHLGEELGLPAHALPWPHLESWATVDSEQRDRTSGALGAGLAAIVPAPQVNFRKGELAYRSDFSFLRGKSLQLAAALLAVLAFAALNAFASLRGLRKEQEQLQKKLSRETVELFGVERLDAKAVSEELKNAEKGSGASGIPSASAFDLLDDISHRVPPGDKIKLDILELDIKPKKVYLKATAETAQQVDDLTDALSKIECFEEIQKGKLSSVQGPAPPPDKDGKEGTRAELKQFDLTIKTTCQ